MDFLSAVRSGKNPRVGPHVIVIGGGNAAIDVAMTAFRQGATKVQMWYRRNRAQMPANPHEVELALAEGVELVEFWAPTRVLPDNRIEFERSRYAPDAKTVAPVTVRADHIMAGIGQDADLSWLEGSNIKTEWGNIVVDQTSLLTDEPGIFAAGDIAHGASTVVAAIGSGKRAAESINSYLMGVPADYESLKPQRRDEVPFLESTPAQRVSPERAHIEEIDPQVRKFSHEFMQFDWDEKVAAVEAERCLRCDICIGCGLCELACSAVGAEALKMVETNTAVWFSTISRRLPKNVSVAVPVHRSVQRAPSLWKTATAIVSRKSLEPSFASRRLKYARAAAKLSPLLSIRKWKPAWNWAK